MKEQIDASVLLARLYDMHEGIQDRTAYTDLELERLNGMLSVIEDVEAIVREMAA